MSDTLKLSTKSILTSNFKLLENNFAFIVNGNIYPTNKFTASFISPIISNLLSTDKTLNSFVLNTPSFLLNPESKGDFQTILNLVNFQEYIIEDKEKEFICEVLEKLENSNIKIKLHENKDEITNKNAVCRLLNHSKYPHYYHEMIEQEIEFISKHMYLHLSNQNDRQELKKLEPNMIERIVNNEQLVIKNEDQLLSFINELYNEDQSYSILYQYIDFVYCSSNEMNNFLNTFCVDSIDHNIWQQLGERLKASITFDSNKRKPNRHMKKINFPKGTEDFDGIIRYLQKSSKNIKDEIEITSSSIWNNNWVPDNVIQYDNNRPFVSQNLQDSSICFQFKNYKVIPTCYTIRSRRDYNGHHPQNWAIEISNDSINWEEINQQKNCQDLTGLGLVHTFDIEKSQQKEAKFIRLIQKGKNSSGNNHCSFNSIEFYGYLCQ